MATEAQTAFISYSREDSEFVRRLAKDLPVEEQIRPAASEELGPGRIVEPEPTETVERQHAETAPTEIVQPEQSEDERQSPPEAHAEEASAILAEDDVVPLVPDQVHAESAAMTAADEAEASVAHTPPEPVEDASPISVGLGHVQSEAAGDKGEGRSVSVWHARFPGWAKIAVTLCGVLIVGTVLYWVWTASQQRSRSQAESAGKNPNSAATTPAQAKRSGTWSKQISGTKKGLESIVFSTPQSGWAVGEGGIILHTEDAGETWKEQASGMRAPRYNENLVSVTFPTPQMGWALSNYGDLVHTEDAGDKWVKQTSRVTPHGGGSMTFATPQSGWLVGIFFVFVHGGRRPYLEEFDFDITRVG